LVKGPLAKGRIFTEKDVPTVIWWGTSQTNGERKNTLGGVNFQVGGNGGKNRPNGKRRGEELVKRTNKKEGVGMPELGWFYQKNTEGGTTAMGNGGGGMLSGKGGGVESTFQKRGKRGDSTRQGSPGKPRERLREKKNHL